MSGVFFSDVGRPLDTVVLTFPLSLSLSVCDLVLDSDIFFPTNFEALAAMYARVAGEGARTTTSACSAFFKEHADLQRTTTMSGYNPLIEDFTNTKVFVGTTRKRTLR